MSTSVGSGTMSAARLALLARRAREDGLASLLREPIAVIGMGCRFPGGANTPEQFWSMLQAGFDAVREAPADRWSTAEWFDPDPATPGKTSVRHAGFLADAASFDAGFFGISRREAERMDPHQRIALEVAWEALEDAGLPLAAVWEKSVGVFAASYNNDYVLHQYLRPEAMNERTITGLVHSIVANRISYYLGLHGPSLTIDTACSSSLVAVHLASQSLRSGECDVALAGGVSLMLRAEPFVAMSKAGFMSPDGRCKTFDARADGFGRGEGCGFVVLRRLSDALAFGNRIDAVIRGSAVNQDGRSTVLAAPNGRAQVAVVQAALADGQIDPAAVSAIEAHGTGTRLGDPIEVESLAEALGPPRGGLRAIASVKANMGHLEAAAGIAGLIKAALCLRHRRLPPQVQFHDENPLLRLKDHGFEVPLMDTEWEPSGASRMIGVSSFGIGGTNAHVVLEQPPGMPPAADAASGDTLLVLSARTPAARDALAARYADLLERVDDTPEAARVLCASAALHRTHFDERMAVVGGRPRELAERLRALAPSTLGDVRMGRADADAPPRVVFVFNGQGSQWAGMGAQLLNEIPEFRRTVEEIDALFAPLAGWSLLDAFASRPVPFSLDDTACAQPLIFAMQLGLARVLEQWGVQPVATVGHSIGELAAACIAGHVTVAEAVPMVFHRGRVMQLASPNGAMLAARLTADEAHAALTPFAEVTLAAVNGPRSVVFSGQSDAVARLEAALVAQGVQVRALTVRYGFHSAQMRPLEAQLREVLRPAGSATPRCELISTVTGQPMAAGSFDPAYVARNVVSPVRFYDAVRTAIGEGANFFVEIGPRAVLGANLLETLEADGRPGQVIASATQQNPGRAGVLSAVGAAYCAGVEVRWEHVVGCATAHPALPKYPWQHERYWLAGEERAHGAAAGEDSLLGARIESPAVEGVIFRRTLHPGVAQLADHRIGGQCLVPAAMMLEMARAAGAAVMDGPVMVRESEFLRPVVLSESAREAQLWIRPSDQEYVAELHTRVAGGAWSLAFRGTLERDAAGELSSQSLESLAQKCATPVEPPQFYQAAAQRGCDFGPSFRRIRALSLGDQTALAWLTADDVVVPAHPYTPSLLDAAFQPAIALLGGDAVYVPSSVGRFRRLRDGTPAASYVREVPVAQNGAHCFDVQVLAADGQVLAIAEALTLRPAPAGFGDAIQAESGMYGVTWRAINALPVDASSSAWPTRWAVVGGDAALTRALRDRLATGGAFVEPFPQSISSAQARSFLDRAGSELSAGWIVCNGLEIPPNHATADDLLAYEERLAAPVREIVKTLTPGRADHIILLSRGAQPASVTAGPECPAPWGASLAGLSRAIRREHPHVRCTLVDLDRDSESDAVVIEQLFGAPLAGEPVLARRDGRWLVPRLEPLPVASQVVGDSRAMSEQIDILELTTPGDLASIRWGKAPREAPSADEVEIRVVRGALNFRDVLASLGMVASRTRRALGHECAGVITKVGAGVRDLAPGDEVVALAEGAFAERVTCSRGRVFRRPPGLDWDQAATVPIAYLTAYQALIVAAQIQPGQRVLVHNGAGGVGLATIHLAIARGAIPYATAGSPEKREFLRSLGVALVCDSRSLLFRDEILSATGGAGVNVVVNALTGDAVDASLSLLRAGGYFVELGKRELRSPEELSRAFPGVRYVAFDLFDKIDRDPGTYAAAFAELARQLESGRLVPLPSVSFPHTRAVDAFRLMTRAGHIGKILLAFPRRNRHVMTVRSDATYLITGGTGAVGLETASWLVQRGARSVVLASRRAPNARAAERIATLREMGAEIVWRAADLTSMESVRGLVAECGSSGLPLRGVVHAAGLLDDGLLADLTPPRFAAPFGPKVIGAWHLAQCLDADSLDFLFLYSAAGSLIDPAGQSNYASANAVIDALAAYLRESGYPATSVAWGLWQDGMAMQLTSSQVGRWHAQGLRPIGGGVAAALLDRVLTTDRATVVPLLIDWPRHFAGRADPDPLVFELGAQVRGRPASESLVSERLRALPVQRRQAALRDYLIQCVGRVLGRGDLEEVGPNRPLRDLGLDSLMAVELRNTLTRELGCPLSATLAFDYPDVPALTVHLGTLLFGATQLPPEREKAGTLTAAEPVELGDDVDGAIAAMTDEEAERQLLEELSVGSADMGVRS